MKIICLFFFCLPLFCVASTRLLLVGGGPRPEAALKRFVADAGDESAVILIIPWASASSQGATQIGRELLAQGAGRVVVAPFPKRIRAENFLNLLETATGVFFAGGDQNLLMERINSLELRLPFQQRFAAGIPFGGTSAGTAIMSQRMLTGDGDFTVIDGTKIEVTEGLGLLPPEYIVDQHFIVRSRFNRLAGLVLHYGYIGLGVDEGMAIQVRDGSAFEVFGPTQVLILRATKDQGLGVEVFSEGASGELRRP